MRNLFFSFLISALSFASCSDGKGDEPIVTIDSIYIDKVKVYNLSEPVGKNSEIDIYTTLTASPGSNLYTFNIKVICGDTSFPASNGMYAPSFKDENSSTTVTGQKEHISESGISDDSTLLVFKDNIAKTNVVVHTSLTTSFSCEEPGKIKLNVNTNDKATSKKEIDFIISTKSVKEMGEENIE